MQNGKAIDEPDLSEDSPAQLPETNGATRSANGDSDPVYEQPLEADDDHPVESDLTNFFDPGPSASSLEIDTDDYVGDSAALSLYAFSTYHTIQTSFQVETPYGTMPDSATM
jgi:hypothetical protein